MVAIEDCAYAEGFRLWDFEAGGDPVEDHLERFDQRGVKQFSDNGQWVGQMPWEEDVLNLWDLQTGKLEHSLPAPAGAIFILSGDGKFAIVSEWHQYETESKERLVTRWDLQSGVRLDSRPLPVDSSFRSVSVDGRYTIHNESAPARSSDGRCICDWQTGQVHHVLSDHKPGWHATRITNDGALITGGEDGTLRVWDIHRDRCIAIFPGAAPITSLAWNEQHALLCAGDALGGVDFFRIEF